MLKNLEKCSLFKGLIDSEIENVLENTVYQIKHYKKESLIAQASTAMNCMLLLSEGAVRGEMTDDSGNTIKIEDIEAPNLLAPAFLFGSQNKFPVNIISNSDSTIIRFQKPDFVKLLQSNSLILTSFLDNISSRAQFLSGKLKIMSFQTIKGKLAHYFIQVSKNIGSDEFLCPKSQNQLAEMYGVARPSLSRALREMNNQGLILSEGKQVKILDKKALYDLMK